MNEHLSTLATPEKVVRIILDEKGNVLIEPHVLRIEAGFRGVISWEIDHPDAKFEDPPIVFTEGPATMPPPTNLKSAQVWWDNGNTSSLPVAYAYTVMLQHGLRPLQPDPTVENDPPGTA